jgi:hypothetical protein
MGSSNMISTSAYRGEYFVRVGQHNRTNHAEANVPWPIAPVGQWCGIGAKREWTAKQRDAIVPLRKWRGRFCCDAQHRLLLRYVVVCGPVAANQVIE